MENALIFNLFMMLWVYKAVENSGLCCGAKCTHVDKNRVRLFFDGYPQTMLGLVIGCEHLVGDGK